MSNKKSLIDRAVGYYYYDTIKIEVNGEVEEVQVKKYKKPSLSAQKRILKRNGWE